MDLVGNEEINDNYRRLLLNTLTIQPFAKPSFLDQMKIKVFCLNIRSIRKNFDRLLLLLEDLRLSFNVICLTDDYSPPRLSGYNMYHTKLNKRQNDGVWYYIICE